MGIVAADVGQVASPIGRAQRTKVAGRGAPEPNRRVAKDAAQAKADHCGSPPE
jgi:type IV secretory pathway TrbL component